MRAFLPASSSRRAFSTKIPARDEYSERQDSRHEHAHGYDGRQRGLPGGSGHPAVAARHPARRQRASPFRAERLVDAGIGHGWRHGAQYAFEREHGRRDCSNVRRWEARAARDGRSYLAFAATWLRMNTGDVAGYNMATTPPGVRRIIPMRGLQRSGSLPPGPTTSTPPQWPGTNGFQYHFRIRLRPEDPLAHLYERYLWVKRSSMSANMNGWFGDGNAYVGNLNLQPEVANTFSATAGWHAPSNHGWEVKVTPYYTALRIISTWTAARSSRTGATVARPPNSPPHPALSHCSSPTTPRGCTGSTVPSAHHWEAGSRSRYLGLRAGRESRHGAEFVPHDAAARELALEHHLGQWSSTLEFQAVDAKTDVQAVRNELRTPGYALLNLRSAISGSCGKGEHASRRGLRQSD